MLPTPMKKPSKLAQVELPRRRVAERTDSLHFFIFVYDNVLDLPVTACYPKQLLGRICRFRLVVKVVSICLKSQVNNPGKEKNKTNFLAREVPFDCVAATAGAVAA